MKPHDALQLELEGISSGSADEVHDLVNLAEGLRSAAGQIATPPGLQARRGAILATAVPATAAVGGRTSRLTRALVLAGVLSAGAAIGWVGAITSDTWLRGPAPATGPTASPTPAPVPSPTDQPRKGPPESVSPRPTSSETAAPSPTPDDTGLETDDAHPDETLEPGETPDDGDNSGPGSDSSGSGSGSDGDSSGSGSDGDSSGSGSGGELP